MGEAVFTLSYRVRYLPSIVVIGLAALTFLTATAQPVWAETLIECEDVRDITKTWRRAQSETLTGSVECYRVSSAEIHREMARRRAPLLVDLLVIEGEFDVYVLPAAANVTPAARAVDKLNDYPVAAGQPAQVFPIQYDQYSQYSPASYVIVVAPSVEGEIGSYRLRLRVGAPPRVAPAPTSPPTIVPTAVASGSGVIVFPTTYSTPCTISGQGLSNLCVDPYPVRRGSSVVIRWKINNFRQGEFDAGDGRGFITILSEQQVEVSGLYDSRIVRLRWTDQNGKQFEDSIQIKVTESPVAQSAAPVSPNTSPCSQLGIGVTNLCIEPPYPVRRGSTAFAVWRILDFQYGEFDKGDGRGFIGPISAEQRVEITNVTGPRTIRLRWMNRNGQWNEDSFVIQVVD
jgi:hypothetical protein